MPEALTFRYALPWSTVFVADRHGCSRWIMWQERNLVALSVAGCPVLKDFPKSSPDLNAIEGVWHLLKARMLKTEPVAMESRAEFLVRLRRQVKWLNDNQHDELCKLCTNQKERAREVECLLGAKCRW